MAYNLRLLLANSIMSQTGRNAMFVFSLEAGSCLGQVHAGVYGYYLKPPRAGGAAEPVLQLLGADFNGAELVARGNAGGGKKVFCGEIGV